MVRTRSYCRSNADCAEPQQQTNETPVTSSPSQTSDAPKCPTVSEISCIIDGIKNLLECSICRERFLQPKMLPCQHVFCGSCIARMAQRDNCPICRKRFIPHRVRSCLLLNNLLELASKHPSLAAPREPSPPPATPAAVFDDRFTVSTWDRPFYHFSTSGIVTTGQTIDAISSCSIAPFYLPLCQFTRRFNTFAYAIIRRVKALVYYIMLKIIPLTPIRTIISSDFGSSRSHFVISK
uniref:RING finger protein nhl-1 n=1 Tax=Schistocephalus solidus TaxID=70667 RepID=A0A0X3NUC1_SCHSO